MKGLQEILYSPAPGNKTEKVFTFSLNLNALVGGFEFGGKLCHKHEPILLLL